MSRRFPAPYGAAYGEISKYLSKKSKSETEKRCKTRLKDGNEPLFFPTEEDKYLALEISNIKYPSDCILQLPRVIDRFLLLYSERKMKIVILSDRLHSVRRSEYPEAEYSYCRSFYCHDLKWTHGGVTGTVIVPCYDSSRMMATLGEQNRVDSYRQIRSTQEGQEPPKKLKSIKESRIKHVKELADDFKTLASYAGHITSNMPSKEAPAKPKAT